MTTRKELERILNRIIKNSGKEFHLDWTASQPIFCFKSRKLSPRLSKSNMLMWMEAFEEFEEELFYGGSNS